MKFTVSSSALSGRLQTLNRVLSTKNTIQILDCILFQLSHDELKLTASDGEVTLETTLEVSDVEGSGVFAANALQVINGLKEIAEQPVEMIINDSNYAVDIHYQNGTGKFMAQPGNDYPEKQPIEGNVTILNLDSEVLQGGINHTLFATADDELRPVMNGIYFDAQADSLTFVASDGHKLVRDRSMLVKTTNPTAFILPKKPARTLKEILTKEEGEVEIKFDERRAEISFESYVLSCRLIEGRYPAYNSVIPTDNPYHVNIERQSLISALKRVLVFASSSTSQVKLAVESGKLTVSAKDPDFNTEARESLACEYDGDPISIGFKGPFLIEILGCINAKEVVFELADPSRAGVIVPSEQENGNDLLMLLMPMMLND